MNITSTTGSAWGWLVFEREIEDMKVETEIEIVTTRDCKNPYTSCCGGTPLCCIDLWEHAYYIDYGPNKGEYCRKWLDSLINWNFVSDNFHKALIQNGMPGLMMTPKMGMMRMG